MKKDNSTPSDDDAQPGSWLFSELSHIMGGPEESAPMCPKCGGDALALAGGLWNCPECGGVWTAAQIAEGPLESGE